MSTTQPIICCLGDDVAGRPTQFVLERAFEVQRMHWQAISVEVQPDKFSQVSEATLAMGFRGLRFYGAMEREAGRLLTQPGSIQSFVGQATSALNIGDRWQVWDNLGPAWLTLMEQLEPSQATKVIWLQGVSQKNRSVFAALVDETESKQWFWLDAPEELASIEHPRVRTAIAEGRILFSAKVPVAESLRQLWCSKSNEVAEKDAAQQVRIALINSEGELPDMVAQCAEQWGAKLVACKSLKVDDALQGFISHYVSDADLAVAGEAYDFKRWTNCPADVCLMRDAYDEYCDY